MAPLTQLLDLCIKNGGEHFLVEVASREFMDVFATHLRRAGSPDVRAKMLRCLQDWRFFAQTKPEELGYVEQVAGRLENEGFVFPAPDPNAVAAARAFAESVSAPAWEDNVVCTKCRSEFTTFLRKHHCRNCGRVFCYLCSGKTMSLPWYGIGQDVRVCDGCFARKKPYAKTQTQAAPPKPALDPKQRAGTEDADLARAIALSLQEAQPSRAAPAPTVTGGRIPEGTDADDPDLAAAIAASLRDLPPEPVASEPAPATHWSGAAPSATHVAPVRVAGDAAQGVLAPRAPLRPSLELEPRDVDNVLTFSQTVLQPHAPWKAKVHTDGMPRPVQNMYEKAASSRLRVVRNLDEGTRRLNQLASMHEQLSEVVRLYDSLLDAQVGGGHAPTYAPPHRARAAPAASTPFAAHNAPTPSAPFVAPSAPMPSAPATPSAPAPSAPSALSAPMYGPSAPPASAPPHAWSPAAEAVVASPPAPGMDRVHSRYTPTPDTPSEPPAHVYSDRHTLQPGPPTRPASEPQEAPLIDL